MSLTLMSLTLHFPATCTFAYVVHACPSQCAIAAFACISRVRALWLGCVLCGSCSVVRVRAL